MARRIRLQDVDPPRLLTEAEVAYHLGLSAAEFSRRAGELERLGLPRRHPILNKRDLKSINAWLDGEFGLGACRDKVAGAISKRLDAWGELP